MTSNEWVRGSDSKKCGLIALNCPDLDTRELKHQLFRRDGDWT